MMANDSRQMPVPFQDDAGKWVVGDQRFPTNAAAWRYIDRMGNEPMSRAEDVNAWINRKMLDE